VGKQRQLVLGIYQVRQAGAKKFAMGILGPFSYPLFPVFRPQCYKKRLFLLNFCTFILLIFSRIIIRKEGLCKGILRGLNTTTNPPEELPIFPEKIVDFSKGGQGINQV
jgi:hypothetical protein